MGLRFRKSIKIAPGLKINISKSGISATIGGRGSSVNIGNKGTYLNLGIPGMGISYREKISGKTNIPEYESLQSNVDDTQDASEEISHIDNSKACEAKPSSNIFLKLLKFICCCFFCLIVLFCILGALTQGKEWLCFPVAFAIAGSLTVYTIRRKGENSSFKWWLYGALVPFVSWIDAVMLNSENRDKAFMKGVAYSLAGLIAFFVMFANFLP